MHMQVFCQVGVKNLHMQVQKFSYLCTHLINAMKKLLLFAVILASCTRSAVVAPASLHPDQINQLNYILNGSTNIDSLQLLADRYLKAGNKAEAIRVFRRMGNLSRETTNFFKAIEYHNRGLSLAQETDDLDEVILALNQIGTNYRRLNLYEKASTYHHRALEMCDRYEDKSSGMALKNLVMSHSGIGNVQLMFGSLDEAYQTFQKSLAGETQLGSNLGMAMNYSNIGMVYEGRGQYDSAKVYYELAMKYNQLAGTAFGVSLSHIYIGRLAEHRGDYDEALREYQTAYDALDKGADRWHWLEACLSIIRANIAMGNMETAAMYIGRAEATANELRTNDYLSLIHKAKYSYYEKLGGYHSALDNYILSRQYADSTQNVKNINHLHNLQTLYENQKKETEITTLKKRRQQLLWMTILGSALFLLTAAMLFFFWRWTLQKKRFVEQQIKQLEQEKLLAATKAALAGAEQDLQEMRLIAQHFMPEPLTTRETELLKLIVEGYTLPEQADKMCLGTNTIRSYRQKLNTKLGVHNTAQLVQNAKALGLV